MERKILKNHYRLKSFLRTVFMVLLVLLIFNADIIIEHGFSADAIPLPVIQAVLCLLAIIIPISACRNTYEIGEEELGISESVLFIKTTNMKILYSGIDRAVIKWSWAKMRRALHIEVCGKVLVLNAESCMQELLSEIEKKKRKN